MKSFSKSLKAKSNEKNEALTERGQWANPVEFVLSALAYAVGLGNIWRFPYMCYVNGGGAFLIPYSIMLIFVGIPILFIEFSIGQFSSCGTIAIWEISPIFKGVGCGMVVISILSNFHYIMICAWAFYYVFASFQSVLPWQNCDHPSYNTANCYSKIQAEPCEMLNGTWFNETCYNKSFVSSFDVQSPSCNVTGNRPDCWNATYNPVRDMLLNAAKQRVSASEEYFNYGMLRRSEVMEDQGGIHWDLCLVLLLSWIICFLCIFKSVRSVGKVVYFTAVFPYVIIIILLGFGASLPGSAIGIQYYLKPTWSRLLIPKVWVDAAIQIFYSVNIGAGGLLTYASYNKFHNNVYRDTIIVAVGNCLTSFLAGFAVFAILGFMADDLKVEVKDVVNSGSGLAFVVYPEVVTRLPVPHLWSILFFLMLVTLGIDSMVKLLMTGGLLYTTFAGPALVL